MAARPQHGHGGEQVCKVAPRKKCCGTRLWMGGASPSGFPRFHPSLPLACLCGGHIRAMMAASRCRTFLRGFARIDRDGRARCWAQGPCGRGLYRSRLVGPGAETEREGKSAKQKGGRQEEQERRTYRRAHTGRAGGWLTVIFIAGVACSGPVCECFLSITNKRTITRTTSASQHTTDANRRRRRSHRRTCAHHDPSHSHRSAVAGRWR